MQNNDDPFAFTPDSNRTVVVPTPGRRTGGAAAVIPPPPGMQAPGEIGGSATGGSTDLDSSRIASANPLLRAAGPLFTLVRQLRSIRDHSDIPTLRADVLDAIRRFQAEARAAGVDPKTSSQAAYALSALVDETVLGTPWGLQSIWSNESILITLFREATAGETFFNFLRRAKDSPREHLDILEFLYVCISLGFQGKFRVEPGGADRLNQLRGELYTVIARERGEPNRALSIRWQGVEDKSPKVARFLPLWVAGIAALALLILAVVGFNYSLNDDSDGVYARIASLVPTIARPQAQAAPIPPPPPTPLIERLRVTLAPEIAQHLVAVEQVGDSARIVIFNKGLFPSGGAEVGPQAVPLIQKIGLFLADQRGPFQVVGHTDNQPIRSLRFPSNWHLSKARADAVAKLLTPPLAQDRVEIEGRADSEPIGPNDTADGRQQNRRVEISLPSS